MTLAQMLALSLGLSAAVAAVGGLAALVLQRFNPDPRLRERGWSLALWTPVLAPLATALLLLGPAPVLQIAPAAFTPLTPEILSPTVATTTTTAAPAFVVDWNLAALILLGLAAALTAVRLIALAVRTARLNGLVRAAEAAPPSLIEAIHALAADFQVRAPAVRVSATTSEALLAGLIRPVLILPHTLAGREETPDARAVFAHELAHLKRRDHYALWLEEALLAVLAINPLLPLLRRVRAAAREEACDALALAGAAPEVRRAYARTLIEALKSRADLSEPAFAPALTFTGTPRSLAMSRLKAVLDPAPAAGRRARLIVLGVAALILGLAGGGAFAVAGQREPEMVSADAGPGLPIRARDTRWLNAALEPVYKAAWPKACGFGSNSDGAVFVQIGKGCTTEDVADPVIESIAFVDPSRSPRDAFAAVKAACDAGLEVPIRFRQGGMRAETSVRCTAPAVMPAEPKAFEVRLTWRGVTLQPGDRLVVALERKVGDTTFRRSLDFSMAEHAALPASVKAMVEPEYFQGQRSPSMKTALIGRDGRIRAVSGDRELPMLVRDTEAVGYAVLSPATDDAQAAATEAQQAAARAALATQTPDRRTRYASPSAADMKGICGGDATDGFYCDGVLYGSIYRVAERTEICMPLKADGDMDSRAVSAIGRPAVARAVPSAGQSAQTFVQSVVERTFRCRPGQTPYRLEAGSDRAALTPTIARQAPSRTVSAGEQRLNGQPMPAGLPIWAIAAQRVDIRDAVDDQPAVINVITAPTAGPRIRVNGRLMPARFGVANLNAGAIQSQRSNEAGEIEVTLKPLPEAVKAINPELAKASPYT
ncbi:M56 family metallopeptidase [Brevundimonas goettingensis]|uniref:M56 family metallopeptidase n=1 Tax=Brevundimonas goettingensis TaxID=2774190 RepID=A0A975GY98_9CAUL|nr:M56 family metallopeptidase [Brevundimonas goettingensis]QTC91360.1 M56 family metallopeptidase [Brevundimonas goettingensis]